MKKLCFAFACMIVGTGSTGVVNHTLFSDRNPPAATQITGLDDYIQSYLDSKGIT